MSQLSDVDIGTTVLETVKCLGCLKSLLAHIDRCQTLQEGRTFYHLTNYIIGALEKCPDAAIRLDVNRLACATRNLFEAIFVCEYLCASEENARRFRGEAALDELEIMTKLEAFDRREPGYAPDPKVEERMRQRQAEVTALNLGSSRPLMPRQYAQKVGRETEYDERYRFYSKLAHATAWAILGGCSWDALAKFTLVNANGHAAESFLRLAQRTGFPLY